MPDGGSAIIVAEEDRRLDFRDPHTMQFQQTVRTPQCRGINHADFAIDGSYAIFSCEFGGNLIKFDVRQRRVIDSLKLPPPSMPQDVRIAPNGGLFYIADMLHDGVILCVCLALAGMASGRLFSVLIERPGFWPWFFCGVESAAAVALWSVLG